MEVCVPLRGRGCFDADGAARDHSPAAHAYADGNFCVCVERLFSGPLAPRSLNFSAFITVATGRLRLSEVVKFTKSFMSPQSEVW